MRVSKVTSRDKMVLWIQCRPKDVVVCTMAAEINNGTGVATGGKGQEASSLEAGHERMPRQIPGRTASVRTTGNRRITNMLVWCGVEGAHSPNKRDTLQFPGVCIHETKEREGTNTPTRGMDGSSTE